MYLFCESCAEFCNIVSTVCVYRGSAAHVIRLPSQDDKWTSPWEVNNKVTHSQPHLSLSQVSHRLHVAEIVIRH